MVTGGASGGNEASGCSGSGERKSNVTSRIEVDTGGMDRLYVRGLENVHKKLLVQAAACNLALLMRSMYGAGKPRAAHDQAVEAVFAILELLTALEGVSGPWLGYSGNLPQKWSRVAHG